MQSYLFKTNRLGLRLLTEDDLDCVFELEKDPAVQQFRAGGVRTYEQTQELISKGLMEYKQYGLPWFLLFSLETNELVGRAGFFLWETGDIEIGYAFHKKFWGLGYATEAVAYLLQWAKEHIDANYITAYSAIENAASVRVLEKAGMQCFKVTVEQGIEGKYFRIRNK